jgi:hypothetical protein
VAVEAGNLYGPLISLRFRVEEAPANDPWFNQVKLLRTENGSLCQFKEVLEKLVENLEEKFRPLLMLGEGQQTQIPVISPEAQQQTVPKVASLSWLYGSHLQRKHCSGPRCGLLDQCDSDSSSRRI